MHRGKWLEWTAALECTEDYNGAWTRVDCNNNNNENFALRQKYRWKLSSARFSATLKLGTKLICLEHTLET